MIVSEMQKLNSLDARGTFGYSGGFGLIKFSYNRFGFYSQYSGIYSRKKLVKGWGLSRMTFYRSSNPQTTLQQAWRTVFANGKSAYDLLTAPQKARLRKQAINYRMTGYNLFMSRWLQGHR